MNSNWKIFGASVIGKGHIENDIPCQDAHGYIKINRRWIFAITADGAGSYNNSDLGSQFIVRELKKSMKKKLIGNKLFYKNSIPNNDEWRSFVLKLLRNAANNLKSYSEKEKLNFKSLSCTVNLALISSNLVLTANIGDGRACYKNKNGNWSPMIIPFKGEQVGSTIFITSDWIWEDDKYINTQVIQDRAVAFSLLTDGLENYSFLCYNRTEDGMYHDSNKPYSKFFDINIKALNKLNDLGYSKKDITINLKNYLTTGKSFEKELDDKTLIIGFIKN